MNNNFQYGYGHDICYSKLLQSVRCTDRGVYMVCVNGKSSGFFVLFYLQTVCSCSMLRKYVKFPPVKKER